MGLLTRMSSIVKARMSGILDRAEDPQDALDYSYEKQLELLQNVKRGIVEVVTAKRRLEMQEARLKDNIGTLDGQARTALSAGREDLARTALERKHVIQLQIQGLDGQITGLEEQQDKLTVSESRLAAKVEAFRTHKEVIKAQYSAAKAQVNIGEAATGISEEMADVGLAAQRAQERTDELRARASAIDELVAAGTLEDTTGTPDVVGRELNQITVSKGVDDDLARLKKQLGPATQPKQLVEGR